MVMLAFVVTTMPAITYADTISHASKTENVKQAKKTHNCHHSDHAAAKSENTASDDTPYKKSCCESGFCKCLGHACGGAKVLGINILNFLPVIGKETFLVSQDRVTSSLSERIKRPPRA